ncbi:MAG: hypothetical protein P4N60_22810 [Verrucomicrobiae bacterium]|nr:hypothetical protein [Verrucomicrobiae bacterium]
MAQKVIAAERSPYYPPRARWYAVFFYFSHAIRRRLALDRLAFPSQMTIPGLLAGFLVPGLAVYLRGPRIWGQAAMAACLALFLVFIIWLGYPAANLAFGLMLSVHATGVVYYCGPLLAYEPFRSRLSFTLLVLLVIGLLVYLPARSVIQNYWLTPLRLNGQVVIVELNAHVRDIHRGSLVAYQLHDDERGEAHHGGAVRVRAGMGLGTVLAVAGDEVTFSTNLFSVNGVTHTNLSYMPVSGELIVAENHWFIWPSLDISGHGNVGAGNITAVMLDMANVSETQFYGKPFARWFGRKQILP